MPIHVQTYWLGVLVEQLTVHSQRKPRALRSVQVASSAESSSSSSGTDPLKAVYVPKDLKEDVKVRLVGHFKSDWLDAANVKVHLWNLQYALRALTSIALSLRKPEGHRCQ
jgi:hypothetical protein